MRNALFRICSGLLLFFFFLIYPASEGTAETRCKIGNHAAELTSAGLTLSLNDNVTIKDLRAGTEAVTKSDLRCSRNGSAAYRFELSNGSKGLITLRASKRGLVGKVKRDKTGSIELSYSDNGEEYYGIWEYPLSGTLSNRGTEGELSTLGITKDLQWAHARAPFFFTDRGYGFYVHSVAECHFAFAINGRTSFKFNTNSFEFEIFYGEKQSDILSAFNSVVRPKLTPPDWAYGPFWWRNDPHRDFPQGIDNAQSSILHDAAKLEEHHLRATAIWIDRPFTTNKFGWGDWRFAPTFRDPKALIQELDAKGIKTLLWVANKIDGELLRTGTEKNFLYPNADKADRPSFNLHNKNAEKEFRRYISYFVSLGFAGFKLDRGDEDEIPKSEMNWQSEFLPALLASELSKKRGSDYLVISRALYDKGRNSSVVWSGDPFSTFGGLRACLLSALRSGLIGFPFSGSDTGGYIGATNKELFLRWLAVSTYTPLLEIIIDAGNKPLWNWLDGETIAYMRELIARHHELAPYSRSLFIESKKTGMPMLRPLFLAYPEDQAAKNIWDEYLFGPELLVAPILSENKIEREVYLPAGEWLTLTGEKKILKGGVTLNVPAPLGTIPVFAKAPSVVFEGDIVRGNNTWTENWKPFLRAKIVPPTKDEAYTVRYNAPNLKEASLTVKRSGEDIQIQVQHMPKDFIVEIFCNGEFVEQSVPKSSSNANLFFKCSSKN